MADYHSKGTVWAKISIMQITSCPLQVQLPDPSFSTREIPTWSAKLVHTASCSAPSPRIRVQHSAPPPAHQPILDISPCGYEVMSASELLVQVSQQANQP